MACSGKYAPIPAAYSPDLRALVDALLQRDPDARPAAAEVLDLLYVRGHLQKYAARFRGSSGGSGGSRGGARRSAFERSLLPYQLSAVRARRPLSLANLLLLSTDASVAL